MKTIKLNCENMVCPMPVIKTKKELENIIDGNLEVTVDNKTAKENLLKLAASMNIEVEAMEQNGLYIIKFIKSTENLSTIKLNNYENINIENDKEDIINKSNEIILIGSDTLGSGDEALGKILMKGFIFTLSEAKPYPKKMLFINSGVKLTAENEESIENLKKMEEEGVKILSCGTCLDFYNIKDKLAVGKVANMYDIVDTLKQNPNRLVV